MTEITLQRLISMIAYNFHSQPAVSLSHQTRLPPLQELCCPRRVLSPELTASRELLPLDQTPSGVASPESGFVNFGRRICLVLMRLSVYSESKNIISGNAVSFRWLCGLLLQIRRSGKRPKLFCDNLNLQQSL